MLWPSFGFLRCVVCFFDDALTEHTPPIFRVIESVQVDAELIHSQGSLRHYGPVKCRYRVLRGVKTQMTVII
jgi:hypothetical protein